MINESILKLREKKDLTRDEIRVVFEEIMTGKAQDSQIAEFLLVLKDKGETSEEITGAALVMRKFVTRIKCDKEVIFDTCGTGGDCRETFNISTACAFVVAGCSITVAKHGNRSVSSKCGSADVLEALGVNIVMSKERMEDCLQKCGISFLFAPSLHPAMKYAMQARKQLKTRTIFNILGPLTNPAFATHQLLGVYGEKLMQPLAEVLKNLGLKHALVVHSLDGLDEVTTTNLTSIIELKDGKINSYPITPEQFNIKKARLSDLKGEDNIANANIIREVLSGKHGPKRDIVILNAACGIYTADKAADIKEAIKLAEESIDSGKAKEKLELLIKYSNKK